MVARKHVTTAFVARCPSACLVELGQGFSLVPLTAATILDLAPAEPWVGAQLVYRSDPRLPAPLSASLTDLSRLGAVAYLEAEFFAGEGLQAAVVWESGGFTLGPIIETDDRRPPPLHECAINLALRQLGVSADDTYHSPSGVRASVQRRQRLGVPPVLAGADEFATLGLGRVRKTENWPALAMNRNDGRAQPSRPTSF